MAIQTLLWGTRLVGSVTLMLWIGGQSTSQTVTPPFFPIEEFNARSEAAMWLLRYDRAAWKTSDLVMHAPPHELQKLGPEWYCSESDRTWDCYYGRYEPEADRYTIVFHYRSVADGAFRRIEEMPAPDEATPYARALNRSRAAFPSEFKRQDFNFNAFVRRTATGQIEVWHLPAWQLDGTLISGGELCQTFESTGSKILETKSQYTGFRKIKPNTKTELELKSADPGIPTVGNLFFVLAYRDQFKAVSITSKRFITRRVSIPNLDDSWWHIAR